MNVQHQSDPRKTNTVEFSGDPIISAVQEYNIKYAIIPAGQNSLPLFVGLLGSIVGYLIGDRRSDRRSTE